MKNIKNSLFSGFLSKMDRKLENIFSCSPIRFSCKLYKAILHILNTMEGRYIKTDDNKVIQEKHIRWIKKVNDCLNICTKGTGCDFTDTHQVCKLYTPNSYAKLNKLFE